MVQTAEGSLFWRTSQTLLLRTCTVPASLKNTLSSASGKRTSNGAPSSKFRTIPLLNDYFRRRGLTIPFHRNLLAAISNWDPKREALFYVIDREAGGIVARYKVRFYIKACGIMKAD